MDLTSSHLLNIYQEFLYSGHCVGGYGYDDDQDALCPQGAHSPVKETDKAVRCSEAGRGAKKL